MLTMMTINMSYAQPNPCDCDFVLEVVCVEDTDGNITPFPNPCLAECAGFTAADFVDCDLGGGVDTTITPDPCGCDFTLDVVCVSDADGNILPFPNACFAECEGFTAADFVDCDLGGGVDTTITPDPCGCDFTVDVVCVSDADGNILPFPNACFAECEGFTAADFVDCDFGGGVVDTCGCPADFDPVCVLDPAGFGEFSFINACVAECEGFSPADFVDCNITSTDTCGCDFTLEFVCVDDGNGNVIPYPNACFAECDGFTSADFVDCDSLIFPPMDDCYASFWYDYDYTDPLSVQFNDYSSTATSWGWDFGDGNTSTEQNPLHVYSEEGVYDVTLTIVGDSCTSTITQHICIFAVDPTPACEALFYTATPDWNEPLTLQFTDWSLNASTWAWDFGDGNTSTEQNPLHTYVDEGVYDVTLTITSDSCSSSYTEHICVFENGGGTVDTCGCGFDIDPVCVDIAGEIVPFLNACLAECEGFTAADFVDCGFGIDTTVIDTTIFDPCGCTFDFNPVCVEDVDGNIIPYPNACFAECEGFTAADFVDCDFGGGMDTTTIVDCNCDFTDINPVCVEDTDGNMFPFPNACFAECAGFTIDDFINCDLLNEQPSPNQVNFIISNILAFPNPAVDILNISLLSDTEKEVQFNIQNIAGMVISSSTHNLYSGKNTIQLEVSSLQNGLYFLEIQNGEELQTIKFLK